MSTEKYSNNPQTTLSGAITSGATSLSVVSFSGFSASAQYRIIIDAEIMIVTAGAGTNTWTVTRGAEGTSQASHTAGTPVTQVLTKGAVDQILSDRTPAGLCEGRLTLTSGTAVTASDVTAATTIYFTPYRGSRIALYNGTLWVVDIFAETTIALGTLTSALPYDLFAWDNAGVLAFDAPLAWTSATARATALTTQDGVLVKSGDATRRYIGTFYTTSTTTTEDSVLNRFLWNMYNRAVRKLEVTDATSTWSVNLNGTWRQARATAANRVQGVIGWQDEEIDLTVFTLASGSAVGSGFGVAIGEDSTSTASADCWGMIGVTPPNGSGAFTFGPASARFVNMPAVGYHAWNWLEQTDNSSTTFFGSRAQSAGNSQIRNGISGYMRA